MAYIWRWGVELLIRIWLIYHAASDPMVRVRTRLFYPQASSGKPAHRIPIPLTIL